MTNYRYYTMQNDVHHEMMYANNFYNTDVDAAADNSDTYDRISACDQSIHLDHVGSTLQLWGCKHLF